MHRQNSASSFLRACAFDRVKSSTRRNTMPAWLPVLMAVFVLRGAPDAAASDNAQVSNAVHEVRVELETALGRTVPSLSLYLQTPDDRYFASSASSPEHALARRHQPGNE